MTNENLTDTDLSGDQPVQLLGDFLKEKRLAKNLTLEKISQKTKINLNILKAIENNDYQNLPSAAYIKGFVTSYSKTLGLDQAEVYSKMEYTYYQILGKGFPALNHTVNFKPAASATGPQVIDGKQQVEEAPHEVIENSKNVLETSKSFLPVAIFAGIVITIVGGYQIVSSIIKNEIDSQKQTDLGPTFEPSSALFKDKQTPVNKPADAAAPVAADAATEEKKEEVVVEKPLTQRSFPTVEFRKIRSRLFTVVNDAPENSDETILPAHIKSAFNPDLQNIFVKATEGSTWLSYKVDEKPIESVIIEKGKDLFIQGAEVRIFFGNVKVAKIFYNNLLIDAQTKSGVKSLIFPESSNSKYVLPLFPKAKDDILHTSEDYMKRMKLEEDQINKTTAE